MPYDRQQLRSMREGALASVFNFPEESTERLPASTPLFHIPSGLTRILDPDLEAAGIPKRDESNRVVNVHTFKVTFGTHLCAAGVPRRTAQAAMRHSKPELTVNIYTDPKLLNVAGAIDALPALAPPQRPPCP